METFGKAVYHGNSRRKYKFTGMQQLTVGGHARVETTCRKSGSSQG